MTDSMPNHAGGKAADQHTPAPVIPLPELERQCETCEGTGVIYDPEWAQWWKRHQAARLQFEAVAPGDDWYTSHEYHALDRESPDGPEEIECRKCRGTGTVPTAAGRALLTFLANWGSER